MLILDVILLPFVIAAAFLLKAVRRAGLSRLNLCRAVLMRIGVLPIRRHYYEPFTDEQMLRRPLDEDRSLPGIDWNIAEQLALLESFRYADELGHIATSTGDPAAFNIHNGQFESGDAEFLYQMIRSKKPRRVIEIGSGNSTLLARDALKRNRVEGLESYHICIEPFEAPWLEQAGIKTLRQRVEDVDPAMFQQLEAGDLLFIDSSHIIRPQGDVLTEYLQILPSLRTGVIVHVHDIFSPRDYSRESVLKTMWLWNEQYLLEAFLSNNRSWKVIGALNLLMHHHYDALKAVCPFLTPDREPGSFYLQKIA